MVDLSMANCECHNQRVFSMAHELAINSQPDVNEKTSVSPRLG
jgi:hypothetical protein